MAGTDRFGRITNLTFNHPVDAQTNDLIHRYQYGYDSNGNRTFARIDQNLPEDDRSYRYHYDALNRLQIAERGTLNADNTGFEQYPEGRFWALDIVGKAFLNRRYDKSHGR